MSVPIWFLVLVCLLLAGLTSWSYLLATGRNPLPFPDSGSRIVSASTRWSHSRVRSDISFNPMPLRGRLSESVSRRKSSPHPPLPSTV